MPAYLKKTNHTNFLNVVPGPCNVEMIFSFYQVCSVFNLNLILLKGLLDKCNFFTTRGNFRKYDSDQDFPGCIIEVLKGRKTYFISQPTIKRPSFIMLFPKSTQIFRQNAKNDRHQATFRAQIGKRKSKSGNLSQPPNNLKFLGHDSAYTELKRKLVVENFWSNKPLFKSYFYFLLLPQCLRDFDLVCTQIWDFLWPLLHTTLHHSF